MIVSLKPDYALISLPYLIYPGNVFVNMSTKEDKINETNINRTKFSTDNTNTTTNFNERTNRDYNNTLNQQQNAINKTLDNTLHNIKRSTDEATREIPQYSRRIAEYNAAMVNNFTSYLLNASNLINNALASNMRVYNTALEQTRDNVKAFAKTNTNYIKSVVVEQQESVNRHNAEVNTSTTTL